MTEVGAFAQKVGRFLHLKDAPPSLVTRSLRSAELAVTETRDDHPVRRLADSMPPEDAYLVSLKFRDYGDCECWERGKCVIKTDIRAGATYLYDLKRDPRYVIDKPFHSLFFHLPRSALDDIAKQAGAPRIGELSYQPGVGHVSFFVSTSSLRDGRAWASNSRGSNQSTRLSSSGRRYSSSPARRRRDASTSLPRGCPHSGCSERMMSPTSIALAAAARPARTWSPLTTSG